MGRRDGVEVECGHGGRGGGIGPAVRPMVGGLKGVDRLAGEGVRGGLSIAVDMSIVSGGKAKMDTISSPDAGPRQSRVREVGQPLNNSYPSHPVPINRLTW
jgi:hypothetical protein